MIVKTIPEMRHEVIDKMIKIELMVEDIIKTEFGFEEKLAEVEGYDGEPDTILENEEEILRFEKFFLDRTNLDTKFRILKDIIERISDISVPTELWGEADRLRKIRNIFAHTLAPEYPDGHQTLRTAAINFSYRTKKIEKHCMKNSIIYLTMFIKI